MFSSNQYPSAVVSGLMTYAAVRTAMQVYDDWPITNVYLLASHVISVMFRFIGVILLCAPFDELFKNILSPVWFNYVFYPERDGKKLNIGHFDFYVTMFLSLVIMGQISYLIGYDNVSLDDIFDGFLGCLCLIKVMTDSQKIRARGKRKSKSQSPERPRENNNDRQMMTENNTPPRNPSEEVSPRPISSNRKTSIGGQDSPNWSSTVTDEDSPCRGTHYINMLSQSAKHGDCKKAEYWLGRVQQAGVTLTLQHYNTLLESCSKSGNVVRAEYWFRKMKHDDVIPDVVSYTLLVNGFAKCGELSKAEALIRNMHADGRKGDAILYGALVHACVKAGKADRAEYWINEMETKLEVIPNVMSFNMLLDAFAKRGDMQRAAHWFDHMANSLVSPNIISYNSMIDACAKSGDVNAAEAWLNRALDDEKVVVDVITFNALIDTCAKVGDVSKAASYIDIMRKHDVNPDVISFTSVINGYAQLGDVDKAEYWLNKMEELNVTPNIYSYNAVLNATVKAHGSLDPQQWLKRLSAKGVRPNVVTYTTLSQPFASLGEYRVVELLMKKLENDGIEHNQYTFGVRLNAVANATDCPTEVATKIFEEAVRNNKIQVKDKLLYPFARAVGRHHMHAVCERLGIQPARWNQRAERYPLRKSNGNSNNTSASTAHTGASSDSAFPGSGPNSWTANRRNSNYNKK